MIKLNAEESKWLSVNFALSKRDLPNDFYEPKKLINILIGKEDYRGLDYKGDSMSFIDDVLFSYIGKGAEFIVLYCKLVNQLIYLHKESLSNEYYECSVNISELLHCLEKSKPHIEYYLAELKTDRLLNELNIKTVIQI